MLWIIIAAAVIVPLLAVVAFVVIRKRNAGPISVVMLRTTPRRLTEADVRAAFRRVHKRDPQIQKIAADPTTDCWLVVDEELPPVGIIDSRRMYADKEDMERTASRLEHPTTRAALVGHTAWVSVDAMGVNSSIGKKKRAAVYGLLGPLAAELVDQQCMLLYLPAEDRVAQPGEKAEELLREGKTAELFGDADLHAPLFQVEKQDEAINKAIEEARRRLPEFCMAYERLGDKANAMIKGRFKTDDDGGNEYVWLSVLGMTDDGFAGTVENNPIAPMIPPKGSRVEIKLDDIVDWAYVDEKGNGDGLFVDRILIGRQGK